MQAALSPGFSDPVADAQTCFRAILDAMARPGTLQTVPSVSAPFPLCYAAAAALLTLVDQETPLALDREAGSARSWIAFHTGAPIVPASDATFTMALSLPDLTAIPNGTEDAPETAATVILQVPSLVSGSHFRLQGPGLRIESSIHIEGLPGNFAAIWQRNHAAFPRGADLILCAGNQLLGLPRSVIVSQA